MTSRRDNRPIPDARIKGRLPPELIRCPGCGLHIYPQVKTCPHCKRSLTVLRKKQLQGLEKARKALATLQKLLGSP